MLNVLVEGVFSLADRVLFLFLRCWYMSSFRFLNLLVSCCVLFICWSSVFFEKIAGLVLLLLFECAVLVLFLLFVNLLV